MNSFRSDVWGLDLCCLRPAESLENCHWVYLAVFCKKITQSFIVPREQFAEIAKNISFLCFELMLDKLSKLTFEPQLLAGGTMLVDQVQFRAPHSL